LPQHQPIFSKVQGVGPAVVLVHALGFDHSMWDRLASRLALTKMVIQIDLRGHGQSPSDFETYKLNDLAHDIASVLDQYSIVRADFVGLSLGGMVGQAFALQYSDRLNKLVLACTSSSFGDDAAATWNDRIKAVQTGGMRAIVDIAMRRFFSESFANQHVDEVDHARSLFLKNNPKGYIGACNAIAQLDFSNDLQNIKAHTLIITGELDVSTPVLMSQLLHAGIECSQLVTLANTGHLASTESAQEFNRLVVDFLA
jgi:3-oxoadipate enol-lactonase